MKKILSIILSMCIALTLLPVTGVAIEDPKTLTLGEDGTYPLSAEGFTQAITEANDGDTIQFISDGVISLTTGNIAINKSITLDLNGKIIEVINSTSLKFPRSLNIENSASITIKGPGTMYVEDQIYASSGTTLTVQDNVEIIGTGGWPTLDIHGSMTMIGGAIRHTDVKAVLRGSGHIDINDAIIENNSSSEMTIITYGGTTNLTGCTIKNGYVGIGTWSDGNVITAYNQSIINITGGSITGPAGVIPLTYKGAKAEINIDSVTTETIKATAETPLAPTLSSKTYNSVTLTANSEYLFSKDGSTWQESNVFTGLTSNTMYTFYQKVAETEYTEESLSSEGLSVTTDTYTPPVYIPPVYIPPTPVDPGPPEEPAVTLADIEDQWASDNIELITRGQLISALGRLANTDVSTFTQSSFTDVDGNNDNKGFIEWARENNIIKGIGNNLFAPDHSLTREQMAVIMVNYAKYLGVTLPQNHTESFFTDDNKISTYAMDAVKQMQIAGIMIGKSNNTFDPQGIATLTEITTVLRRFMELVNNSD